MTVHLMHFGQTACLLNGPAKDWPAGHFWSVEWKDVTCPACLAGREFTHTFRIAADGNSITCLKCGMRSYNHHDVEQHYCGHCHVFHDDIWPPARKAWMEQNKSR
jgi:hypothetical protein